jgi:hypothetical protein
MGQGTSVEKGKKVTRPTRYASATIFSKISFWWLNKLVLAGSDYGEDDLGPIEEEASKCYSKFMIHWNAEILKEKPSLLRTLFNCFWRELFLAAFFKLCWGAFLVLGAFYFVNAIVSYVQGGHTTDDYSGWILACFFFLDCFILSCCLQQMYSQASRLGTQVRAALLSAVYQKTLKVRIIFHLDDKSPRLRAAMIYRMEM